MRSLIITVVVSLVSAIGSQAQILYDFSLPANGDVDAIDIQLLEPDFLALTPLNVVPLNDTSVSVTSGIALDLANSFLGYDVSGADTLIGIALFDSIDNFLLVTFNYPDDFFDFSRAPSSLGTFTSGSTGGNVLSEYTLATNTPTATLVVTETPEPGTLLTLALGLSAFVFLYITARIHRRIQ